MIDDDDDNDGGHFLVSLTIIPGECIGYEMVHVDNQQGT